MLVKIGTANIFILLFLCFFFVFLWKRYQTTLFLRSDPDQLAMGKLKNFLLSQEELRNADKPILWIPISYEYNARNWESWGSRSSYDLNQPYLYLCLQSILRHCSDSFKICIIDDASFSRLLPTTTTTETNINMSNLSEPILSKVRQLLLLKLLREYGGMICPVSFICLNNLIGLFQEGVAQGRPFICCCANDVSVSASASVASESLPCCKMMGVATKEDPILIETIHFAEQSLSQDYTAESIFLRKVDRFAGDRMTQLSGKLVGTETLDDQPVLLENLFSDDFGAIQFYSNLYGIWVPADKLLQRIQYGWFVRSSVNQLLEAEPQNILEKYLILANSPPSLRENFKSQQQTTPDIDIGAPPSKWISFWRTPMGVYSYGLKPTLLGYNVPHKTSV
jgi:hypothetical protein